jgi:hypothetical protein
MVKHFVDDDTEYLIWLTGHPTGYVLNCERDPKPNYLVLHLANCTTISGTPSHGVYWTRDLRKVCADSVVELDRWARDTVGTVPSRCGMCHP